MDIHFCVSKPKGHIQEYHMAQPLLEGHSVWTLSKDPMICSFVSARLGDLASRNPSASCLRPTFLIDADTLQLEQIQSQSHPDVKQQMFPFYTFSISP